MKTLSLIGKFSLTLLVLSLPAISHGQTLIGFDFSGYENSGPAGSSSHATGVGASALSLPAGSGLSNNNQYPNNYDVRGDSDLTLAAAETDSDYISFTVTPTAGYTVNVSSLSFVLGSFGGSVHLALTNSSKTVLGTASGADSSSSSYQQPITLSLMSGGTITAPTTFRLYAYGNANVDNFTPPSKYTLLFNNGGADSFDINGTATPGAVVPEPSSFSLGALGAGLLALILVRRSKKAVL